MSIQHGLKHNTEDFINFMVKKYNNLFGYELTIYKNLVTPVKIRCNKCNYIIEGKPQNLKQKCLCPNCGKGKKRYKNTEEMIEVLKKIHNNKYDYSLLTGNKLSSCQKIICPDHGVFVQNLTDHKRGTKCPKCVRTNEYISKNNWSKTLKIFKEIHKNENNDPLYIYDEFVYVNNTAAGIIICPEHGKFSQTPEKHKKGYGCPKCPGYPIRKKPYTTLTHEKFVERSNIIHNFKYDYSEFVYVNNIIKGIINCPKHGKFIQDPLNHLNGSGCPKCAIENKKLNEEDLILEFKKIHGDKYSFPNLGYTSIFGSIQVFCNTHKRFFYPTASNFRQGTGCPYCKLNKAENFLTDIFEEYNIDYLYNDRRFINPLEIDILVDSYKFGIEHNGLVYHSYGNSNWSALNNYNKLDKQRHLNKTKLMEAKDYQLFHIREDQLRDPLKKDIWKSILLNKCNISNKIHARKLQVVNLGLIKEHQLFVKKFLDENHLQGSCNASIQLGLQDPKTGVIYSIMTFGVSRFNKNIEWELLRFCNLKFHNVRGAASKLLKAFERWQNPKSLISYANRDWSQGNVYNKLGFEYQYSSEPNYIYITESQEIIKRQKVQKHKLKEFLESRNLIFKEELSERDNMINNNFRIYYDTGNLVYHKYYN